MRALDAFVALPVGLTQGRTPHCGIRFARFQSTMKEIVAELNPSGRIKQLTQTHEQLMEFRSNAADMPESYRDWVGEASD